MIVDALLKLAASQAVTATAFSTNTVDLSVARDIAAGQSDTINVVINVEVAATAAGAATVNFQVVTSANANLSTPTIIGQTDAIAKTALLVGTQLVIPVPRSLINQVGQRYLGLQFTIGTGPLTAGTFTAYITLGAGDNTALMKKVYPSGWSIK